MCVAVGPAAVPPSPKLHAYAVSMPSGSDDPVPSAVMLMPSAPRTTFATAFGGTFAASTVTVCVLVAEPPRSSVPVRLTV